MSGAIVLAGLLAAAAVVFVSLPFVRAPGADDEPLDEFGDRERRELKAAEERDRVLAELKELEFDHRTGKVTDDDYRALVHPLRRRAAQTLANGASLPGQTPELASEQHFSESSLPSSRRDR